MAAADRVPRGDARSESQPRRSHTGCRALRRTADSRTTAHGEPIRVDAARLSALQASCQAVGLDRAAKTQAGMVIVKLKGKHYDFEKRKIQTSQDH